MKESHLFDPKHIDILESEDRKTWQNPEEIIETLDLKPSYIVADVGCGSGYFTVPISRKVKKVYGIDFQKEILEFLEEKIRKQKNIEYCNFALKRKRDTSPKRKRRLAAFSKYATRIPRQREDDQRDTKGTQVQWTGGYN